MQTLDDLRVGAVAHLVGIEGNGGFRRRLLEMGFLPGTPIRLQRRVSIGGVLELELRGCRVALRSTEAQRIRVDTECNAIPACSTNSEERTAHRGIAS